VGGGTGGSTLTSLLAKNSNGSVLLIEAGGQFGLLSRIPLLTTFQQKGINDWSFLSVPQKHSSRGLIERRQCLPRGKGLGGSANLNYMLHFDGHGPDFDSWRDHHNLSDWSWAQMRSFMAAAKPKNPDMLEIPRRYSKLTEALEEAQAQFAYKDWIFRRSLYNIRNSTADRLAAVLASGFGFHWRVIREAHILSRRAWSRSNNPTPSIFGAADCKNKEFRWRTVALPVMKTNR